MPFLKAYKEKLVIAQLEEQLIELRYAEKLQHALFKIASISHEEMDLQQLYQQVHLIINEILDAKNFFIALYDEEMQTLHLPYFVDENDIGDEDMTGRTLNIGNGLSSYVISTRMPQLLQPNCIRKLIEKGKIGRVLGSDSFFCWMGAPMISAGVLHGVMVIQTYTEGVLYNEKDLQLLDFVANHVADAIEKNINNSQRRDSQLKLAEQHRLLEQKNVALTQTVKELQSAQEELVQKEKMASLGGLVAGIAHEINTPLGICVTAVSHLAEEHKLMLASYKQGDLTESALVEYFDETDQALKILSSNTQRSAELVRSFKQVAVDQSSNENRTLNIRHYLSEILLSLKPKLKRVKHEIEIDCPEDLVININAGAISQIFSNLIINSIIHGFDGIQQGKIQIKIYVKKHLLYIHYADDGNGLDEISLSKLFDPFYTTKRASGGSGLGTHLIFNLVSSSLKGTIKVKSEIGKGVAYLIKVPI